MHNSALIKCGRGRRGHFQGLQTINLTAASNFQEYVTFRDPKSARDAFKLNEEKAPDGSTHGGFGFVDDTGNLHYIQYKRDQKGHL